MFEAIYSNIIIATVMFSSVIYLLFWENRDKVKTWEKKENQDINREEFFLKPPGYAALHCLGR